MSRLRTTTRLILVVSMMIAALASSQASAQRPGGSTTADETAYESELTGLELTWSDDWALANSDVSEDSELIQLDSDLGFIRTGFAISEDDAEWGRDEVLNTVSEDAGSIEVIDEDTSRGLSWSLVSFEDPSGESFLLYIEVLEDYSDDFELVTLVASGEDDFIDVYELAYDGVEIDGDPLLDEFDVDEIDEMIAGGALDVEADEETTPDADTEDESETGLGTDDSADAEGDSYAFEIEDIEVVVSGDVEINEAQVEEGSYEQILLVGVGSIGAVSVLDSPGDAEDTLDGFMGGFLSEMEDSREIEVGVDGSVAWGIWEANVSGMDMYVYATVNDDMYDGHYLELLAAPVDFFEDEFLAYQESVQINGADMFDGIDVDDLLDIIDAS